MNYHFFLVFALLCSSVLAQTLPYPRQSVFVEAGGNGLGYSLNYERSLNRSLAVRLGGSWLRLTEQGSRKRQTLMTVPVTISYLLQFGASAHHAEFGAGISLLYATGDLTENDRTTDLFPNLTGTVGYRYQRPAGRAVAKGRFHSLPGHAHPDGQWRVCFCPLGSRLQPWGGIGIGYGFLRDKGPEYSLRYS